MMCKTVQYMIVVTCLASVYTLVLMSLDRFLAVVHPISSMSIRTEKNALMYVKQKQKWLKEKWINLPHFYYLVRRATILAWVFIFTTAIPTAICHGEITYVHKGVNHTACLFLEEGYNHSLFQVSYFVCIKFKKTKCKAVKAFLLLLLDVAWLKVFCFQPCFCSEMANRGKCYVNQHVQIDAMFEHLRVFETCCGKTNFESNLKSIQQHVRSKEVKKESVHKRRPLKSSTDEKKITDPSYTSLVNSFHALKVK